MQDIVHAAVLSDKHVFLRHYDPELQELYEKVMKKLYSEQRVPDMSGHPDPDSNFAHLYIRGLIFADERLLQGHLNA